MVGWVCFLFFCFVLARCLLSSSKDLDCYPLFLHPHQHHLLEVSTRQPASNSTMNVAPLMPTVSEETASAPTTGKWTSRMAPFCLPHTLYPWPPPWTAFRLLYATWNCQCSTGVCLFVVVYPEKQQFHEAQLDRKRFLISSPVPVGYSLLGCPSDLR